MKTLLRFTPVQLIGLIVWSFIHTYLLIKDWDNSPRPQNYFWPFQNNYPGSRDYDLTEYFVYVVGAIIALIIWNYANDNKRAGVPSSSTRR